MVTIPALSEMIIKANPIKTLSVGTNVVIDSTAEALQTKGLLILKFQDVGYSKEIC
jgi:hypothetical protein